LGTLALASEVEREALLVAGHISEGCARIVVWTLRTEGHTARHLGVGPDFAFKRLNLENLVLKQHFVLLNCLPDAHILAVESGYSTLLASVLLSLGLGGVIGVVTVKVAVIVVIFASVNRLLNFFTLLLFFLAELEIEALLFLRFFDLSGECAPREFDGNRTFVHDLVVLV